MPNGYPSSRGDKKTLSFAYKTQKERKTILKIDWGNIDIRDLAIIVSSEFEKNNISAVLVPQNLDRSLKKG